MEYRARIEVPGLPVEDEARWGPLADRLETDFGRFGPVLSWEGRSVLIVMSTEATDRSTAARDLFDAVAECLSSVGLSDSYPVSVEVEAAEDRFAPA
jgi:hypothetical protein